MTTALALIPAETGDAHLGDNIQAADLGIDAHTDVEALCLCALLWAPTAAARTAVAVLETADFQQPIHQELYAATAALIGSGAPHDPTMVAAALEQAGKLAGHHGRQRSRHLTTVTTRGADHIALDYYVRAVLAQAYRRSFVDAAQSLAQAAQHLPEDQLFEHLLTIGRQQRTATERLRNLGRTGQ
ncbi:DnaB-like helicase N-terminal domain-containing protein [Rhodococcus marinonascens]|uniref:DnaB-like helicase N-terminal domain-containing protein n=1 Tax=Rhodococcus marinonascens TaxID=38311 RepID=UPI000932F22C|nr:DnaB-like helicase N-terminal domain-containing protein [Rhodococcus marinonascens]